MIDIRGETVTNNDASYVDVTLAQNQLGQVAASKARDPGDENSQQLDPSLGDAARLFFTSLFNYRPASCLSKAALLVDSQGASMSSRPK